METTGVLVCDSCDRESDGRARGWRASRSLRTADSESVILVMCPDCADEVPWLASLAGGDRIREQLTELDEQERFISRQRRQLHRAIDFLRGPGASEEGADETLSALSVEEREISDRRRELHLAIDRLRDEFRAAPD